MLLFLRGSNAGHDATRRASPSRGSKHTALPAVLPSLGQVPMLNSHKLLLVPLFSHRKPQGQVPLERLVKPECTSYRQTLPLAYQHATWLSLLEVCPQDIFSLYRINSL